MRQAKMLFDSIPELSAIPCNVMINAYGQNGFVQEAKRMFDDTLERDVVSWNSLMAAYAQNGHCKDAVHLFTIMDLEGVEIDEISFLTVIDACTNLGEFFLAKGIHSSIEDSALSSRLDSMVFTSIVNMYGKCGRVEDARRFFQGMKKRNFITWNAMMGSFAENGHRMRTCGVYRETEQEGVLSDRVTFLSVLFASSHAGLVTDALEFFHSLQDDYGLRPGLEHYRCIVDLLGRLGQLEDSEEVLSYMPFEPDAAAWMALLGSCKIHGDVGRGGRVARLILRLDPHNLAACRLWSSTPTSSSDDWLADE
ncbi:hypothetical protein SELMODRAFT_105818 [Selaginella moellendorffii]|uniref:Pentacotripeptide-repeat region of PRORP domain-containing protein n=1 Tax=Selaginella moellendorffii TaxID=88036 RepID=D8S0I2_SELML|nr:hypothetical protein SELMODRAFT_105818 [Selaginella moellendorffii]